MLLVLNVLQSEVMVFFLPCFRQILQNIASPSKESHGHKVNHLFRNFRSSVLEGLQVVEELLVLPNGPSLHRCCPGCCQLHDHPLGGLGVRAKKTLESFLWLCVLFLRRHIYYQANYNVKLIHGGRFEGRKRK